MRRLLFLCFSFITLISFAQTGKEITGRVLSETGQPLQTVTVSEKGTSNAVISDEKGDYLIKLQNNNATLVFSYVGYTSKEVAVGNSSVINVTLNATESDLTGVVVTALGIKRELKSLGYASQQVTSEQISEAKQPNLINALQGKVAGVTISGSGGGPGQGASILIRGVNSLNPSRSNQPLFIIDGMPVDNSTFTTGTSGDRGGHLYPIVFQI
ncbi:MAG: carboxypeptidase-like regulatory domain-containing protein [Ilyomonas sp.]